MLYILILNREKKNLSSKIHCKNISIKYSESERQDLIFLDWKEDTFIVYMHFPDKVIIMTGVKECRFRVVLLYARDTLEKMSISLS